MAGTYNRVIIIGKLGRDPELRHTQGGSPVCNMNLATDESYKKDGEWVKQTEWHKVVVWGKQAEHCAEYLAKGRTALVEGSLQTNKWQDQQGQNRETTEIKAFRVVFMGGGQQGQQGGNPGDYSQQHSGPPWQEGEGGVDGMDESPF